VADVGHPGGDAASTEPDTGHGAVTRRAYGERLPSLGRHGRNFFHLLKRDFPLFGHAGGAFPGVLAPRGAGVASDWCWVAIGGSMAMSAS
jgi:hypothetical protein